MDTEKLFHLAKKIADDISSSVSHEKLINAINNNNEEELDFCMRKIKDYMTDKFTLKDDISIKDTNKDKNKYKNKYKYKKKINKKPNTLCVVCLTNKSNISFVHGETGHLCCCQECSTNFDCDDKCPICRNNIDNIIKIY